MQINSGGSRETRLATQIAGAEARIAELERENTALDNEIERRARLQWAATARAEAAEANFAEANRRLAKVTDSKYLSGALNKIGVVDAEWKARAERLEALIRPIAQLAVMGDEKSDPRWKDAPKGDEDIIQVNISLGQLRAMRAALSPAPSEGGDDDLANTEPQG